MTSNQHLNHPDQAAAPTPQLLQAFTPVRVLLHLCTYRLSRAVHRCSSSHSFPHTPNSWSTTSIHSGVPSSGGCGLCCGVDSMIFLLDTGGTFSGVQTKFMSSGLNKQHIAFVGDGKGLRLNSFTSFTIRIKQNLTISIHTREKTVTPRTDKKKSSIKHTQK